MASCASLDVAGRLSPGMTRDLVSAMEEWASRASKTNCCIVSDMVIGEERVIFCRVVLTRSIYTSHMICVIGKALFHVALGRRRRWPPPQPQLGKTPGGRRDLLCPPYSIVCHSCPLPSLELYVLGSWMQSCLTRNWRPCCVNPLAMPSP